MILFEKDWQLYPTAIPDYNTKNRTFVDLAAKYRKMGVKNYKFLLALHQPELQGVDPHSPYLSMEQRSKISMECFRNPWYWFREVARIPPQGSMDGKPFRANRGNIAFYWCFFAHVSPANVQPRQTGKSAGADMLDVYLVTIGARNALINVLTKDSELRSENVERVKTMRILLPDYLQAFSKKDPDNTVEIACTQWNNRINYKVAQNSPAGALKVGRGLTAPLSKIDEVAFVSYVDISIPAMLTAGTAARAEAKAAGMPYGSVFMTTAGKLDSREGKYAFNLIHGGIPWNESLLDSEDEAQLHRRVERGSMGTKPLVNITLSHRQLGYTDEWAYNVMRENDLTGEAADRDIFNVWTSGSLRSPLSASLNKAIRDSEAEPVFTQYFPEGYNIRWYVQEHEIAGLLADRGAVVGIDTSDAVGRDGISLVFLDPRTVEILAVANVNETNLYDFARWLADRMIQYERMVIIPERRSSGPSIIDMITTMLIAAGIDPFRRIYNQIVDDSVEHEKDYRYIQQNLSRRDPKHITLSKAMFGFTTSGSGKFSRSSLYTDVLLRAAKLCAKNCRDKTLIDEITALVEKNGRIDHTNGLHDDTVIAWLLGVWFLTVSKNHRFYGLDNTLSESCEFDDDVGVVKKAVTPYDAYMDEQQSRAKLLLEELADELSETRDPIRIQQLEHRMRALYERVPERSQGYMTLDKLFEDARTARNRMAQARIQTRASPGPWRGTNLSRRFPGR